MPAQAPVLPEPDAQLLEHSIRRLAAMDRPSASDGEREAAYWLADAFRAEGAAARVERERAHGGYWWPLGLLAGIAGVTSLRGGRLAALAAGVFAAVGISDDISGGRQWFRRTFLPMRDTHNVIATVGDPAAEHTVLLIAHHDAAHWSLVFHPGVGPFIGERWPKLLELSDNTPPLMFPIFGGPVLVALGALTGRRGLRRLGTGMSLATAAAMAEIGSRSTVPGANDNLTGVATLLGVARTLREHPVPGLRVILLSTGSEESFMEGMQGFARRHFASLPTDRTHVICIDTVGSPELLSLEGEGMLWMREYPAAFKDLVSQVAAERGITLHRGMRFRNATDGLLALKAGYPSVMIGSMNKYKVPSNYHWPTDIADNVNYATVADCVRLCDGVVRRLARVIRPGDGRR
ncbi:MAG: hypothetical protein JWO02_2084 [Solirubrobacterales bacterium]|nr:hypothetical protein [Solirubrobacterales bacterium]